MPRAIVLIIDGLGCKHLGPYGNTSIETTGFNQLASESLLLENLFVPFSDAKQSLSALLKGRTAVKRQVNELENTDLLTWLAEKRIPTKLFADDANMIDHPLSAKFAEQTSIVPAHGLKLATEWDETHAAEFFAQAMTAISQQEDDSLLWLHTFGLGNPWDAPYDFRAQFAGEEDPDPSSSAQVPSLLLDADYDPDTVHEIQCAYAGQVALLDQCLGVLLSGLRETAPDTLFVMTSLRGFPLGEHLQVGWVEPTLYHELLHVPCLVRFPSGHYAMRRDGRVAESAEIANILVNWFQSSEYTIEQPTSLFSVSCGSSDVLLRTPVWQLRYQLSASEVDDNDSAELYLKPDDQNEVNNVADLRSDVTEAGRDFLQSVMDDSRTQIDLPDVLLDPPE